ncbi:MAG: DUF6999 family protein [Streptosporangiaceae bacterium]
MAADPSIPIDPVTLGHIISDQRRASRAFLYPWIRLLSRAAVTIIVAVRRLCPVRFAAPAAMDRLCLLFLRRCVCPTAVSLLIRHFIVETNLLNFCAGMRLHRAWPRRGCVRPGWPSWVTARSSSTT